MVNTLSSGHSMNFVIRTAAAVVAVCATWFPGRCLAQIELRDVTAETGITFRHDDGHAGNYHIIEFLSAGLATFDYDSDGLIDIYFLNGRPLPGRKNTDPPLRNALYRNLGNWRFADVTRRAGVDGGDGYGLGVAVGDYNNDGHPDLYLNNYGPNILYRNNGDGTFTDVTAKAGVGRGNRAGAGACFLDIDEDGFLDLYVANYVQGATDPHQVQTRMGYPMYPGPRSYKPERHHLFRNNGDGTFTDVTEKSGILPHVAPGMGMIAADYDNDGHTDILVGNDEDPNFLFHNDGHGHFQEVALAAGVGYDFAGTAHGSMGVECGDVDRDGLLDFFITSYHQELPILFRNLGRGMFDDVTVRTGANKGTSNAVKWGTALADLDNDGDLDIVVACGGLQPFGEKFDDMTAYLDRPIILKNLLSETGKLQFVNVSDEALAGVKVKASGRGLAIDDLDNDGDLDIVILNSRGPPTILRNMLNEHGSKNHWIQIQLRGTKSNRDGVGARVRVTAGDLVQIDEVHAGRSYQSHFGSRLHFGLGSHDIVDRIEVSWIGGGVDVLKDVRPDRLLTIVEGSAKASDPVPNVRRPIKK
jgi:hypothetical protein